MMLNKPSPLPSVVTEPDPTNVMPSPAPDGSHAGLEKSSRLKVEFARPLKVPPTVVTLVLAADVSTGKFWKLFGPESTSPTSLGVTPPAKVTSSMIHGLPPPVIELPSARTRTSSTRPEYPDGRNVRVSFA